MVTPCYQKDWVCWLLPAGEAAFYGNTLLGVKASLMITACYLYIHKKRRYVK